jgi:hypothetical protein
MMMGDAYVDEPAEAVDDPDRQVVQEALTR